MARLSEHSEDTREPEPPFQGLELYEERYESEIVSTSPWLPFPPLYLAQACVHPLYRTEHFEDSV